MSNTKTWGDMLEQQRVSVRDVGEYIWLIPQALLDRPFDKYGANDQYFAYMQPGEDEDTEIVDAKVLAYSKDYVYFLDECHEESQCVNSVPRNPPT